MHYSEDSNYTPVRIADLGNQIAEATALIAQIGAAGGEDAYNQAQYEKHVAEQKERQDEINRHHFAEVNPGYNRDYTLDGEAAPSEATRHLSQFHSIGKSDASVKDTVVKLFKEYPFLRHFTIKINGSDDPGQTFDAHYREGREISLFSKDGVYRNVIDLDAELATEIPL